MTKISQRKIITFVDLFAGIGGFHIGIMNAAKELGYGYKCILAVDINKKAQNTYRINFPGTKILSDIKDAAVKAEVRQNVDILCGGFPCQPFSLAGKKKGILDDRGTLFTHIVDILNNSRPKAIFLENVKNLLNIKNSDGTSAIDTILEAIEGAGYVVKVKSYKATHFGLPTYRQRVYFVGFRKDILGDMELFNWPKKNEDFAITLHDYFRNLPKEWNGKISRNGWPRKVGNTLRVGGIGSGFRDGGARRDKRNWDSYIFFEGKKSQKIHELNHEEAKAIMGFPHDFNFNDLSRHQALRQLGNSVAVPVITAIAGNIIKTIYD